MFVLLAILVGLVTYLLWQRRDLYKLSWQLPGPFALPIIGNILSLHPNHIHVFLDRISKINAGPIRLWLGPIMVVLITDAENAEIILKSKECLNKPDAFYKSLRDTIQADGLITLPAEKWKVHRRLISPTVNQFSVNAHIHRFNENIRQIVASLPLSGDFFDILPHITLCKITMFIEAALGTDLEPEMKKKYVRQLTIAIGTCAKRMFQPLFYIDFIWNLTSAAKRIRKYTLNGRKFLENLISSLEKDGGDGCSTFLSRLLDASKTNPNFTKDDIYGETFNILAPATDTTSTLSAFVTLMLAIHPHYQERVFEEVLSVMPNIDDDLTQEDLGKLELMDLCVRETLRLFPTMISRISSKPIELNNNIVIPPNVPLLFGIRQIHIQEKYFGPTANVFDPCRFLGENMKDLPAAAYIPFSYGARDCVGYYYAEVSVKLFIAHLIRNYRLTTPYTNIDQLEIVQNISMQLTGKHMIKLEARS